MILAIALFGLVIGSFVAALTYRVPRGEKIWEGRSRCPRCKKTISATENIPVLSFFLLKGKCKKCNKKISKRYPLIEIGTSIVFVFSYIFLTTCTVSHACFFVEPYGIWKWLFFSLILILLVSLFVIDFEHQILPDALVFSLLCIVFIMHVVVTRGILYDYMFAGFVSASFLLLLNLVTKGRGMGLGDVKLAIPLGALLGPQNAILWMMTSFVLGAVVGLVLIAGKKASFGRHIAFGPFLIISFFLIFFFDTFFHAFIPLPPIL